MTVVTVETVVTAVTVETAVTVVTVETVVTVVTVVIIQLYFANLLSLRCPRAAIWNGRQPRPKTFCP